MLRKNMKESEQTSAPSEPAATATGAAGVVAAAAGVGGAGTRAEHACCLLGALVGLALVAALVGVILMKEPAVETTRLRQLYVLVAHGERTPSEQELGALGSLAATPAFTPGTMTLEGKMLVFEMGALLRKRYGDFLGPYFVEERMSVVAADEALSKSTALLVAAGLFPPPPAQLWDPALAWQPVPYTYPPRDRDYLLYSENCPRYLSEQRRVLRQWETQGLLAPHRDTLARLAQLTRRNHSTVHDAALLHSLFLIQEDLKLASPRWAKHMKRRLAELARLEFAAAFHTDMLRRLSGGALLEQILSRFELDGAAQLTVHASSPRGVAALLAACVGPPPRAPDAGVALLLELHERHQDRERGIKVYYWDDDSAAPRRMDVAGCAEFCSLHAFRALSRPVRTASYRDDCHLITGAAADDGAE